MRHLHTVMRLKIKTEWLIVKTLVKLLEQFELDVNHSLVEACPKH